MTHKTIENLEILNNALSPTPRRSTYFLTTVQITKEQRSFLKNHGICLSKFVRNEIEKEMGVKK